MLIARSLHFACGLHPEIGVNVHDTRKRLCNDAAQSFTDERLQQEAEVFVKIFQEINLVHSEPPNKRRKFVQTDGQDQQQMFYQKLVMTVNGGKQESLQVNLLGIHTTIT